MSLDDRMTKEQIEMFKRGLEERGVGIGRLAMYRYLGDLNNWEGFTTELCQVIGVDEEALSDYDTRCVRVAFLERDYAYEGTVMAFELKELDALHKLAALE
jgi:hypothetical protein